MQLDRSEIESSLSSKGFGKPDQRHHRYFHHKIDGKVTGVYTYTSHGPSYKTYSGRLLSEMRKQLKFDSVAELAQFVHCEITAEGYNDLLVGKGIIPEWRKPAKTTPLARPT